VPGYIAAGNTLWGEYMGQMGRELIESNNKLWSCASLESGYKDFLFKLVHGKLYLNNQLANFADVRRECTFCTLQEEKQMRNENVMRNSPEYMRRISNLSGESVSHLLWGCRWVNSIIESTFNRLTEENNRHINVRIAQIRTITTVSSIFTVWGRRIITDIAETEKWGLKMGQLWDNLMGIFQE
jgi:hypothetical protein